jgi:hypothetical protein
MGYLTQQQAVNQMLPAPPKPDPIPIIQPEPRPAPDSDDGMDGQVVSVNYGATLALQYKNYLQIVPFNGTTTLVLNQRLIFKRGGKVVAEATVTSVNPDRIDANMNYGQVREGDGISLALPAGGNK